MFILNNTLTHCKSCMVTLERKLKTQGGNATDSLPTAVTLQRTFDHISFQDFFRCHVVGAEGDQGQE